MFEQAFKNIDDVLWKEAGCTTELDYTEQTSWLLSATVGPTGQTEPSGRTMPSMSIEELEAAALKLEPKARARLAERLLDSLENLSPEENARIWAEEAQRRAEALDSGSLSSRSADEVFREARARI